MVQSTKSDHIPVLTVPENTTPLKSMKLYKSGWWFCVPVQIDIHLGFIWKWGEIAPQDSVVMEWPLKTNFPGEKKKVCWVRLHLVLADKDSSPYLLSTEAVSHLCSKKFENQHLDHK